MNVRTPTMAVTMQLLTAYRHNWRSSAFNSFLYPVFLLAGFGLSVGRYVDTGSAAGVSYLEFVAPGLLAMAASQVAATESAWQVLGGFQWSRVYHSMRVTPARVEDILTGHLGYVLIRSAIAATAFFVVVAVVGAVHSWWVVLAVPVAVLTALAVAAPVFGFSASIRDAGMFDLLFRLGVLPMALMSGIYFPLGVLPDPLRFVSSVLPLSHGVELTRMVTLGTISWGAAAVDVACLLAWSVAGFAFARFAFRRRLSD